ncbi:MAG: hypothetical protein PHE82_00505 [Syntrophomonadaceae bacterium]|jgi:hypothetical protein|nr:hypothetical protein [Syntrophomonadaceae bacterium]
MVEKSLAVTATIKSTAILFGNVTAGMITLKNAKLHRCMKK